MVTLRADHSDVCSSSAPCQGLRKHMTRDACKGRQRAVIKCNRLSSLPSPARSIPFPTLLFDIIVVRSYVNKVKHFFFSFFPLIGLLEEPFTHTDCQCYFNNSSGHKNLISLATFISANNVDARLLCLQTALPGAEEKTKKPTS